MKLPFFRKSKQVNMDTQVFRILVTLSDWCPACLEYKAALNGIMSNTPIKIEFIPPSRLSEFNLDIEAIPTTFYIKGDNSVIKQVNGFLTCEEFIRECFDCYRDLFGVSIPTNKEGNSIRPK